MFVNYPPLIWIGGSSSERRSLLTGFPEGKRGQAAFNSIEWDDWANIHFDTQCMLGFSKQWMMGINKQLMEKFLDTICKTLSLIIWFLLGEGFEITIFVATSFGNKILFCSSRIDGEYQLLKGSIDYTYEIFLCLSCIKKSWIYNFFK